MRQKILNHLNRLAWILFVFLLFLNLIRWGFNLKDHLSGRELPFEINNGKAVNFADSTLIDIFQDKTILKVDTLEIKSFSEEAEIPEARLVIFQDNSNDSSEDLDSALEQLNKHRKSIEITYQDSLGIDNLIVNTVHKQNNSIWFNLTFNALFLIFIFFNSYLLLRYSQEKANILVVFFLLFLACPNRITATFNLSLINTIFAGLLGVLFYHFILEKLGKSTKISILYLVSSGLIIISLILNRFIDFSSDFLLYIWSLILLLLSFIRLRKEYKITGSIELKRFLNAFKGLFVALIALIFAILMAMIIFVISKGQTEFNPNTFLTGAIVVVILISLLIFLVCILWFFGAFTWSLLTGTAMGVKIRSTMIYTIVGVLFVVLFGLIDYSLGELLQSLFGKFMGSEFIAGIPATIGLLLFFNPVRQKVEKVVDNKLNTSDLDFLEKTESFANTITGESVIEGFEEYICENLMHRLPIKKVALISYDNDLKSYKFNEIRGSDVIENSKVEDVHLYLLENTLIRNYGALNENPQEIASFALIIPIIYDIDHKWLLALGAKNDGTTYSKRDEEALSNLADRVRLSLKFILEYDKIIDNKINEAIDRKNKQIKALKEKISLLEKKQEN